MKIIIKDNFDRECISDRLVAENVESTLAHHIAEALNEKFSGVYHPDFFVAVEDDYKLYVYDPT